MMNVGKMDKRILVQRAVQRSNDFGDHVNYETVKKRWAHVKAVRGSEYYEAQKLRSELTYKITCRYFLIDGKELTPDMQLLYGGKTLKIVDVINIDEKNKEYEIHATAAITKEVT